MISKEDFDRIYEDKLTPDQRQCLKPFLQGNTDQAIAKYLKVKPATVRKHIAKICNIFKIENKSGEHYRLRDELVPLFIRYKPELVCDELKDKLKKKIGDKINKCSLNASKESSNYIDRPPIESDCEKTILTLGALIRIKAPENMGKTCLMRRIIEYAKNQKYLTVVVDFQLADNSTLESLENLLKWFCQVVTDELELSEDRLKELWKGSSSNYKANRYFEKFLSTIEHNLVIALENVDKVFEQPETIFNNFCGLLRNWNQKGTVGDGSVFEKLRLIVVHSTDNYGKFNIHQSPLYNVGLTVEPPEFNREQVFQLARYYNIPNNQSQVEELMDLVGGHPYLIKEAFGQISQQRVSFAQLLNMAPTEEGIYGDYLRQHLLKIKNNSQLIEAMKNVIANRQPVRLAETARFQLNRMGLVKFQGNDAIVSCQLYRQYFSDVL